MGDAGNAIGLLEWTPERKKKHFRDAGEDNIQKVG
jgi:hypothetical protein